MNQDRGSYSSTCPASLSRIDYGEKHDQGMQLLTSGALELMRIEIGVIDGEVGSIVQFNL